MYAFFQKYLENPGSPDDMNVEVLDPEKLWVTKTGQLRTSLEGQSVFTLNRSVVQSQIEILNKKRKDPSGHLENLKSVAARYSGFEYPE